MPGPHTISPAPLLLFLSSFSQKQTEHLQQHLFPLLHFVFHWGLLYDNLWYFLLSFSLQCCVYQPLVIPGKEEICKIFSLYLLPISRPRLFSIKLFSSSIFQCNIAHREQKTTAKEYFWFEVWSLSKALHRPFLGTKTSELKEMKKKELIYLKWLDAELQFFLGQNYLTI